MLQQGFDRGQRYQAAMRPTGVGRFIMLEWRPIVAI
jgi:hypothetical protein